VLKCWGSNSNGQIGDGTKIDRSLPVNVTNIIPTVSGEAPADCHNSCVASLHAGVSSGDFVRSLSLGQRHSCAVMLSGALQCWGSNSNGQLGLGMHTFVRFVFSQFHLFATGDTVDKLTATVVKGLASAVVLVACGSRHTCVKLRGTNRLLCFGLNDFGQSSLATSAPSSVPVTELKFIENSGKEGFSSTVGVFFICMSPRCFFLDDDPHLLLSKLALLSALGEQHSCVHTRQTQEVRGQFYTDHKGLF
jgi:alpha-tubulin suppressor-like RCC1 family protein